MVASVPLLTRRTFSTDGTRSQIASASWTSPGGGRAERGAVAGGRWIASTTFGWAWPATMAP